MPFFASDPSAPLPLDAGESGMGSPKTYRRGTLSYTMRAMVALFAWLLWGDFCISMMDTVVPSVLPLNLKDLGASNTLISAIVVVFPGILNMTVCPWVSFKSDRYRSARGRRIPFVLSTLPFLTISLLMLAWSKDIGGLARHAIPQLKAVAPNTVAIWLIAMFMFAFKFFDMFVGSVYTPLFNDVVPPQFFGRFMGLFKLVGAGAAMIYSYFIFPYAKTNMREILAGAAILYFFGFGLMSLRVKEGQYPPPDTTRRAGLVSGLKEFASQCFTVRIYWYYYLMSAFTAAANVAVFATVFFQQEMGLTLRQWGTLFAISQLATLVGTYFAAIFMDRWHPYRVAAYLAIFAAVSALGQWIWVPVTLPVQFYFWLVLGSLLANAFATTLLSTCYGPLGMRIKPLTLFGQFSAANAMIRSLSQVVFGLIVGLFLDAMLHLFKGYGETFGYRFQFVWIGLFGCGTAAFLCLGYREWRRLGGDSNYRPPAPWLPGGFDPLVDKVQSALTRPRTLRLALVLNVVWAAIGAAAVGVLMSYMRHRGMTRECFLFGTVVLPASVLLALLAWLQMSRVQRDIVARLEGHPTKLGVPHHGLMITIVIQNLLLCPVWVCQVAVAISLSMGRAALVFGIANVLTTTAVLFAIHLVRWIERDVPGSLYPEPPLQQGAAPAKVLEPVAF